MVRQFHGKTGGEGGSEASELNLLVIRVFEYIEDLIFGDGDLLVCSSSILVLGLLRCSAMAGCIRSLQDDGERQGRMVMAASQSSVSNEPGKQKI